MLKLRRRFWLKIFAGLLVCVAVAGLAAWMFPKKILTMDSGPVTTDVIVVLGGGLHERPERAAELFKLGEAPKILISGAGDSDINERLLKKNGVPAAAILVEGKSRTTRENAEFSIPLLRKMGAHKVTIVTSWYHSRRALACFEHYAPDIRFYSRPSYFGYPSKDANSPAVRGYIKSEYVKLLGYWVCYGVCPI